jgi:hypothetical protein
MSDVTDFENAYAQILTAVGTAAAATAGVMGAISGLGAAVVAITALVAISMQTDEIDDAVKRLEGYFDAILSATAQALQMRDIAKQLNAARAQLDPIRQLSPGQSLTDAQRATMDSTTDEVVRTLGDISFWKRPFFPELVYNDIWSGYLSPDPSLGPGSLVFDYRLTLPAYLEAIVIRLIVMLALEGKFTPAHQREIAEIANQLESYYDTIRAGIVKIREPTMNDLDYTEEAFRSARWDTPDPGDLADRTVYRLYGAVEKYSTHHIVDHWSEERLPNYTYQWTTDPTDSRVRNFYATLGLGALGRWKKVYAAVGLPAVRSCLIQLKALAGEPSPQRLDPGSGWSLREVDNLLATAILNQPTTGSPATPVSAIHLLRVIYLNIPTELGLAFGSW